MLRHPDYTRARIAQLADRLQGLIYPESRPLAAMAISPRVERIGYAQALKLPYKPVKLGAQMGPLYATYWFKLRAKAPKEWAGRRVDLRWSTHSEGTLWINGRTVQGLNHSSGQDRLEATLLPQARGGEALDFHIETACNDAFGMGGNEFPAQRSPVFLDKAEIACFDPLAWEMYYDLRMLVELEKEQTGAPGDLDRAWAGHLLFELNRFANEFDPEERATWGKAHRILKALLQARNGTHAHELSAIGHAHIDTAWLWPLAETWRKCVRTFSSQTAYMDQYPEYKFACSQAVQYDVIKRTNPDLYARIKQRVRRGQWIPVGGTWVEPDCNIPSGEALIRQFLYGQRFFEREFGRRCGEFWNPDVFGYNGQLPQIIRHCGATRFLTQKLSWNYFNKPMHHTFHWQGIDGSKVLAHFPPADTYNGDGRVSQLRYHVRNYKDNDRSRHAMYLFGWGDGGGGPTKDMLERLRRCRDLQGLPRCAQRSSAEFFTLLEKDLREVPTIVGELYFELHRGTFTTQAATKRNNRKSEFLLHDIEFLAAVAARLGGGAYPRAALDDLWQTVLTHQFHDILPGSSVRHVYADADEHYGRVRSEGQTLKQRTLDALADKTVAEARGFTPVNTSAFARAEVVTQPDGKLVFAQAEGYGLGEVVPANDAVSVHQAGNRITLENGVLKAVLGVDGRLLELTHKPTGRAAVAEAGNVLSLYDDKPTCWEAWDVDPWLHETGKPCAPATTAKVVRRGALRAEVVFTRKIGRRSSLKQTVRLDAGSARLEFHNDIDWQEARKMLKVAFDMPVSAMHATYEMQFGAVARPTHFNDSIALAQFEVPGHKWADLSEADFGVAVLSESKYGWSTRGRTIHLSLLRATQSPDPKADLGRHSFAYAVYPHAGGWASGGVVAEGYRFNQPMTWLKGTAAPRAFFHVDQPALVLDTVKQAEDSKALVLRLYEAHGTRGKARLKIDLPGAKARLCNGLEDDGKPLTLRHGVVELSFTPYQIISLKVE